MITENQYSLRLPRQFDRPIAYGPNASLEVRINSMDDARRVVYHSQKLFRAMRDSGKGSVEFLIESAIAGEAALMINGILGRTKVHIRAINPLGDNVLWPIPEEAPKQVKASPKGKSVKAIAPTAKPSKQVTAPVPGRNAPVPPQPTRQPVRR